MKIQKIYPLTFIIFSTVIAFLARPYMPYRMASHWGVNGQVDGYMSQNSGLFFMPILSAFLYILFLFLPKLEPYKKNFSEFENYYDTFMTVIFGFLFYIYLLTIFWNLNFRFNMVQLISPAFSILFYYTSILISKTKRNWFVGIRTPWTMSSPKVWQKTHEAGGKLFKMVAVLSLIGIVLPQYAFIFLLLPILFTVVYVFVYSYVLYSRYNQS